MYILTEQDELSLEVYRINCESARKALAQQIIQKLKSNKENKK